MELPLKVPLLVRQRALANGAAGQRWLDGLGEVVATLAERWALDLVEALSGGTASYVVAAIDRSGRPCVLKVGMPLDGDEADVFGRSVRAVLVHGDAHGWNNLDAGGGSFKFIDPEGLRSEREHDLSVAMREYNEPLLSGNTPRMVRQRAEFLASRCGADAQAVWGWGFIERVSTGLAAVQNFGSDRGAAFLEVATRCL